MFAVANTSGKQTSRLWAILEARSLGVTLEVAVATASTTRLSRLGGVIIPADSMVSNAWR